MTDEAQKKIFSKNLLSYLERNQKTQREVAEAIGVSPQTFNTWCQGVALPRMGKIQLLANYFHIEKSALIDEQPTTTLSFRAARSKGVRIPVLGRVAAGIPIEAVEEILDWEEIPEEMAKSGEYFGLRVKGDSMIPEIKNSDILIVRKQEDAESGEIVIAAVNGSDAVCKKLYKTDTGITLYSLNADYEPMQFSTLEIRETPVSIIGKVEEIRRKL